MIHSDHTASNDHLLSRQPRRFWALLMVITAVGLFWGFTIRDGHVWGGDFSLYIRHASNLLTGIPYAETGYILNPADPVVSPLTYPPIFPLLLAPVLHIFGFNLTALKMVAVFSFLIFLAVFIALIKKELPFRYLFALTLTLGFNPFLWDFKDDVRSDIPFLLFTYAALYLIHQRPAIKIRTGGAVWTAVPAGFFCYLAYGTRTIGIVLPAVILLYDIIKQRKITRFSLIAVITFAFNAGFQAAFFPAGSYWEQYIFDPLTNGVNLASYFVTLSTLWENGYSNAVLLVVSILLMTLALTAFWTRLRSQLSILELYTLAYLLVLAIWPVSQGIRFLIPVLPLFFFYIFWGLWRLGAKTGGKWERGLLWGITAVILLSYAAKYTTLPFDAVPTGIGRPESIALFDFIRTSTAENDVIIFRKPRVLTLYTDRPAAIFHPETSRAEEQWSFWEDINARYLIVGRWDEPHWRQFIADNQQYLKKVYANQDFNMYQIDHYPDN